MANYTANKKKKRRRKSEIMRRRRQRFYAGVTVICLAAVAYGGNRLMNRCSEQRAEATEIVTMRDYKTDSIPFNGRYQDTFNDIQEVQIAAAELNGIEPLDSASMIDRLVEIGVLVPVEESDLYEISQVSHPYLVPMAKELLDEIAKRYQQRSGRTDRLRITGCLRTNEYVSKLKRRNVNSIERSCHLFGTTMDISYRYLEPREKRILAQILYELQQAGYCYVKYERKQPCFHITVR